MSHSFVHAFYRTKDLLLGDCTADNVVIILPPPHLSGSPFDLSVWNPLTECMLDYDHCQVNWFTLSLFRTTDLNDHSTKVE